MYAIQMTNPNLQDVRNRRREIRTLISNLATEDTDLFTAEKALLRLGGLSEAPLPPIPMIPPAALPPLPPFPVAPDPTHTDVPAQNGAADESRDEKDGGGTEEEEEEDDGRSLLDVVRDVMAGNETLEQLTLLLFRNCSDLWWNANEIQDHLQKLKGKEVPMGSISPMLTAMKNAGIIVRNGHSVALAERAKEQAEP